MKYPLVRAALILVLSNALAKLLSPFDVAGLVCVSAVCYTVACQIRTRQPVGIAPSLFMLSGTLLLCASVVLSSWIREATDSQNISGWTRSVAPFSIVLTARIRHIETRDGSRYRRQIHVLVLDRLVVRMPRLQLPPGLANKVPVTGRLKTEILSSDISQGSSFLRAGDYVELSGRLISLPHKSNPFDFDEAAYFRSQGIDGILKLDGTVKLLDQKVDLDPSTWLLRTRDKITHHLRTTHKSEASRQLMPAMLLGERQFLSRDVRDQFRRSGLAHLLAISGLHIGILGYSFFWLSGLYLARLGLPPALRNFIRAILSMVVLLLFALLAGAGASVVRAAVMGTVIILGSSIERVQSGLNSMGLAALVLLFFDPDLVLTPGFQLSFTAVTTILMSNAGSSTNREAPHPILGKLYSLFKISFFIFCTTFPIVSFHFGGASPVGILANLVAIPVATVLMISGLLSTLFSLLGAPLWPAFVSATDLLSVLLSGTADYAASLFGGATIRGTPGYFSAFSMAPVMLFLLIHMKRRSIRSLLAWIIVGSCLLLNVDLYRQRAPTITFLSVGQGDAAVIQWGPGKCMVLDTGPGYESYLSIMRHSVALGCNKLDPVLLSHGHADHTGGLERLIEARFVGSVLVPSSVAFMEPAAWHPSSSGEFPVPGWIRMAYEMGVPVRTVSAGTIINLDSAMRLYVLSPGNNKNDNQSENNSSLVVLLKTARSSALFTGDAEKRQERNLITQYGALLRAHLIKVPHHGSSTSSMAPFVDRVTIRDSTFAVISAGKHNRFKHPSRQIVERWRTSGAIVLETARQGAVTFEIRNGRLYYRNTY